MRLLVCFSQGETSEKQENSESGSLAFNVLDVSLWVLQICVLVAWYFKASELKLLEISDFW